MARNHLSVRPLLGIGLLTRLVIDTGTQMFFPFLPVFAQGLGITEVALGRLVSIRSLMGLLSPLATPVVHVRGYRFVLRLGLILAGLGYLLVGLDAGSLALLVGMMLAGLGSYSFIPTLQAYLSSLLHYDRRARGLGFVELGWALSGIFGLFLVGQLITLTSWRVPFLVVGGSLVVGGLLYSFLPPAHGNQVTLLVPNTIPRVQRLIGYLDLGRDQLSAWAAIFANGLIIFAALHTFISFGSWLVNDFGLNAAELGRVSLLLGLADLAGASTVTLIGDRIGKRRGPLLGTSLGVLAFLLLPWFGGQSFALAMVGLVMARFTFEFAIVGILPLLSEQAPLQRNKVLTLGSSMALLGGALAGWTGPTAYARYGVAGLAIPSAVSMLLAWILARFFVRDVGAIGTLEQ